MTVSMLVGTTFAWFTDSVTSSGNKIVAGNLDVQLYLFDGTEYVDISNETKPIFGEGGLAATADGASTLWEPGKTQVAYLAIKNAGSLSLKYRVSLNVTNIQNDINEVLAYSIAPDVNAENEKLDAWNGANAKRPHLGEQIVSDATVAMASGDMHYFALSVHMDEEAGNKYMNGSITFDISVLATQLGDETAEKDSFGSSYDSHATFPMPKVNYAKEQIVESGKIENGELKEEISVGASTDSIRAELPVGVQLADGATAVELSVKTVEAGASEANVTLAQHEEAVSVNVHIEGISADNTKAMLITLEKFLTPGLNASNVRLYHVENGATVEMTAVYDTQDLLNHNEFFYNTLTGDVILAMASFSEVMLVADGENHWDGLSETNFAGGNGSAESPYLIANAGQLAYFRDLVDAGETFEGKYLKLANNIILNHEGEFTNLWDPIGWGYSYAPHNRNDAPGKVFKGTFDGDRYAIHGLWQNGWDLEEKTGTDYTYTNCGGGLFASVENATIKNLVMIDAIVTFECVEIGIIAGLAQGNCNFESIFIYDSKIANYQRATGGVVGEISPSRNADGTAIPCTFNFNKIMLDTSVVVGSLWGDFDCPVGGIIGARWDDDNVSTVNMTACDIACELDVYNDVTSTYQWYAYRRAGMLIGNTDTPAADGKNGKVATADFLTCSDVDVYYTNWTKYNYCQFSNHNSSWPWVRVQAGENCEAYSNPRYGVPNDANGNKVVDYNHVHAEGDQCNVQIYFNQLYGGGQGVYGQPEHEGVNTDVQYLITFMHDDHVAKISFIHKSEDSHKVVFPAFNNTDLPHLDLNKEYEWLDRAGNLVDVNNTTIAADNQRDIFYYLTETQKTYAHFVDKDGLYVAQLEFNPDTGKFIDPNATAPAVPEVPGYYGVWEEYESKMKGAESDIIINAVYSKSENQTVMTDADELFKLLEGGAQVSMSQDLSGGFGSASNSVFCTIGDSENSIESRFDLNSFILSYDGDSSANKSWTLFKINKGSKLTVGDGIAGFGFLKFNLNKLNSNAKPTIFRLEEGATLVLERGVVIEFNYPKNYNSNNITVISGAGDLSQYSGITIDNSVAGVVRIEVTARTVIVGTGSN